MVKSRLILVQLFFFVQCALAFGQGNYTNVQLERPKKAFYDFAQTEPSIAINPSNPLEMVAGSIVNDFYFSKDGGKTWKSSSIKSKYGVWGDPVLQYDKHGAVYYFHLAQYKNVYIDRIVCQRAKATGRQFSKGSTPKPNGTRAQDKQWVAYHHQKDEWYMTWTQFDKYGSDNKLDSSIIVFSKSTNKGKTWSDPLRISKHGGDCKDGDGTVEGAYPTVDRKGNLYVVWSAKAGLFMQKSVDGGDTWLPEEQKIGDLHGGWDLDIPGINRCNGFPVLLADTSRGKHQGRLYLNWSDQRNGVYNTDIWLSYSDDQGKSWSEPVMVNQDKGHRHQFFASMALDQHTGSLYIVYYDRRKYDDNRTDVYLATSTDGGESFTDECISDSPFVPIKKVFFGDYTNISAVNGVIRPIWPRMDEGKISLWTALIDQKQ